MLIFHAQPTHLMARAGSQKERELGHETPVPATALLVLAMRSGHWMAVLGLDDLGHPVTHPLAVVNGTDPWSFGRSRATVFHTTSRSISK
jgi:hypothetical protein